MTARLAAFGLAFALSAPALSFTAISSPTDDYRNDTFLIGVPGNGTPRTEWGDMNLVVSFSTALQPRTVGVNWATWGLPPETEQAEPRIWWTQGATDVTFSFSSPLNVWGFEAQPNPFAVFDITVEYFDGANLVGSITRAVDGDGGARLFAASGDRFTSVRIFSDADFAVAQLRYNIVPEPATWAMLIAGFGMVGFSMRRRRSINSVAA